MEELRFIQGQKRTLRIIEQLPAEIENAKTRLREDFELNQAMRKDDEK